MGTKATAGTCTQGASFQHFPTVFLPSCCLPPLLLPVSTRWSYSNTDFAAAPGEQYTTAHFISMTIFLKVVGFYEKLSFKNKPNRNCRSQMDILPGCVIKRVLAKTVSMGCRYMQSSFAPLWGSWWRMHTASLFLRACFAVAKEISSALCPWGPPCTLLGS